jgi:hypothetical protein
MGEKSAGAHFQQQLSGILSGLLYKECELYMDEILPFADSEEEMLQRLHRLFTRFTCAIGHLIDAEGMNFTRTKLDSISRFKKEPKTMFGVKHFLRLANYFFDHVLNFSVPLQKLIVGYTKSRRNKKVKLEGSALPYLYPFEAILLRRSYSTS